MTCPNCGYCPHCGRAQHAQPGYLQPWYPQRTGPWWEVPMGTVTYGGNYLGPSSSVQFKQGDQITFTGTSTGAVLT